MKNNKIQKREIETTKRNVSREKINEVKAMKENQVRLEKNVI